MRLRLSKFINDFRIQRGQFDKGVYRKIKLFDNKPLSDSEYTLVCQLCDIFTALAKSAGEEMVAPPAEGEFWHKAKDGAGPFGLHVRKNRDEINHSFLLNTRFRDFPTIAYESDVDTPHPDFWLRRYQRLAEAVPVQWRVRLPARFGEIGWEYDGYPVNRLTTINQERINVMYIAGIVSYLEAQNQPRLLEIGAGGGEMGYALCKALPDCTWFDCDLLGSLVYSTIHLAILLPEKCHYIYIGDLPLPNHIDQRFILRSAKEAASIKNAIVNIPHFLLSDFKDQLSLDFAYNTYSFGEMPHTAANAYADLLTCFLKEKGILLEQNGYFQKSEGANITEILSAHQFKEWDWAQYLNRSQQTLSAPTRIWYMNEAVLKYIKNMANFTCMPGLANSFDNKGDSLDIHYADDMWNPIGKMFPQANSI